MTFSSSYAEARARFVETASTLPGRVCSVRHPDVRGHADENLYIDALRMGPEDADVLVLTLSGTHGGEGFCGSAMQLHLMQAMAHAGRGVAVAHIHAVNPFGMSWGTRVNENNVDLNRNWIDFGAPLPEPPLFEALCQTMPIGLSPDADGIATWRAWYDKMVAQHGKWAIDNALTSGQYHMPSAAGFGGSEPQWSRRVLERLIPDLVGSARHVVYLDWHSLLRTGNGSLIFLCFNEVDGPLHARAASWWGEERINRKAVNAQWAAGSSAVERRPSRNGLLMWGVQRLLAPQADLAGAVIEFCTDRPPGADLEAMEIEEQLCDQYLSLTRDRTSSLGRSARERHMEACCPSDTTFRATMIEAGNAAFAKAIEGAAQWAADDLAATPGAIRQSGGFD